MTSRDLSDMIFSIKDKITDKEFKDIMDKLSIKNKEEEEEDKVELYEFTYMKMRKPIVFNEGYSFIYNFSNYKIKTKDVVFEQDDIFKQQFLSNQFNWVHTMPFMLTKSKTQKYHILSEGCLGMCANSVNDMFCKNPLADEENSDDDDNDCECENGCDKCMYSIMKKNKGAEIRYRRMIGLSIKKK